MQHMHPGMGVDDPPRRLSPGHYVGLQIFAIVLPPAVFLLSKRGDRPPHHDVRLNLILLFLLWIPAIFHASMYLNDSYRVGLGREPRYFHAQPMPPSTSPGQRDATSPAGDPTTTTASADSQFGGPKMSSRGSDGDGSARIEKTAVQHHVAFPDVKTLPHHDNASKPPSIGSRSRSSMASVTSAVSSTVSSTATQIRERRANDLYFGHATDCFLCKKCTKCFKDHVRHAEHIKEHTSLASEYSVPDHSRDKHTEDKHHDPLCLCRCCTGEGPPSGRSNHVEDCLCDLCHRPGLSRVPRQRFRWNRDTGSGGAMGSLMIGGMASSAMAGPAV